MGKSGDQIKYGAIMSYVSMALGILVSLLYTPFMIRSLGKSEYGLYNTVVSTVSMLSVLRLGFNNSYIKYYAKYKKDNETRSIEKLNGLFLMIFCFIGFIILICGIVISNNLSLIFKDSLTNKEYDTAKVLMYLLTVNLAISMPMCVFSNIVCAHEKFILLKALELVRTLSVPALSIPLLLWGYKSIALVSVTLVVSMIVDMIYVFYVFFALKNRFVFHDFDSKLFRGLFWFTFFIALELIVDQINLNVDKVLLGRYRGTADVAIYSVGFTLYTYYTMFSSSISGLFTPRVHLIISEKSANERNILTNLFTKVGRLQFLILGLVSSGIVLFGKYFICNIWADQSYSDSYYVAILLVLPALVPLIQNIGIEIQRAENKHQFRSIIYTVMVFANLIMSIYLCQIFGPVGSAIGTSISLVLGNGLLMNIFYHKNCNIDIIYFWGQILKLARGIILPLLIGILMQLFIPTDSFFSFVVKIVIYSLVYLGSMWLFGMNQYEKNLIVGIVSKVRK